MTKRSIGLIMVIVLLVLGAILLVTTASATDPAPQTLAGAEIINLATNQDGYGADFRLKTYVRDYAIADIYLTAALSETDQLVMTIQSSPDGVHAWADTTAIYTFTAATAPAFQHVRVPVYGLGLGVNMNISGSVQYTPTIYVVLKNNAGE